MSHFEAQLLIILIPGSIAFTIIGWSILLWIVAFAGGWRVLRTAYPAEQEDFPTEVYSGCSGIFPRLVHYNHCLKISPTPKGVRLWTIWLFRSWHYPLCLPWNTLQKIETRKGWLRSYLLAHFVAGPIHFHLLVPPQFADRAEQLGWQPSPRKDNRFS